MFDIRIGSGNKLSAILLLLLMIIISSCSKNCSKIENNAYKGYGFFYFSNDFTNSRTELVFIPVCTSKEDLLRFRNLNLQTGLNTYCYFDDSFLKTVAMHSKIIKADDSSGYEYYLTPVYIEFEEAPGYQEALEEVQIGQMYMKSYPPINNGEASEVEYFFSGANLWGIIKINSIDFFSFY